MGPQAHTRLEETSPKLDIFVSCVPTHVPSRMGIRIDPRLFGGQKEQAFGSIFPPQSTLALNESCHAGHANISKNKWHLPILMSWRIDLCWPPDSLVWPISFDHFDTETIRFEGFGLSLTNFSRAWKLVDIKRTELRAWQSEPYKRWADSKHT